MAAKKILGQANPSSAATNIKLYSPATSPRPKQATVSSIFVTNRESTETSFRIFIVPNGSQPGDNNIIYSDVSIPGNETFNATIDITLGQGDAIYVYALLAQLTFHAFGIEENVTT